MKFVVHHMGSQKGPWPREEIQKRLDKKELDWTDYIFDDQSRDWIMILDHPSFSDGFKKWKQPVIASVAQSAPKNGAEWYILRDDNKYGPFLYLEIIKMLQEKKIFEFDYIWNRGKMNSWMRVCEVADFHPDKIREIKNSGESSVKDIFFRRKFGRVQYGASILLHNNKEVWRGRSMEISAGGAGLSIDSGDIQVGQSLFLHFKAGDGVPPFNAVVTIVSKTKENENFRYGVKFTSVSQTVQMAIKKITDIKADKKTG